MNMLLMGIAGLTRFLMRWSLRLAFVVCLLLTNVAGVLAPAVHAAVTGAVWAAASHLPVNLGRKPVPVVEMQGRLADADRRTARLQADLDKKTADLQTATAQRGRIEAERRSIAAQFDTARADRRIAQLQLELDRKSADLEIARTQSSRIEVERRSLAAQLNTERAERTVIAEQLNSARLSREVADASLNRIRSEGDVISARMQSRISKGLARSSGATVLEAIPIVGTVAVIGGIVVDLYDTCQQMEDVLQIRGLLGDDAPLDGIIAENCARATGPSQRVPQADFDFNYAVPMVNAE
ncbi:hypothetical protein QCN27_18510 [Cereibacter sp. SYSU M97828]|nr:hypothetical protein [Cereibacter flavus]